MPEIGRARVGVGVIGASPSRGWASEAHIPAIRALPELELVGIATRSERSAQRAAEVWEPTFATTDPQYLIEHPDIDVVSICVKVPDHRDLVLAALRARKHVYCEWPLAVSADEASLMSEAACAAGTKTVVGLQAWAAPELGRVRELLRDGYVGRVLSASLVGSTQLGGGSVSEAYEFGTDSSKGMNVLTVPAGHALDALCRCLGDPAPLYRYTGIHHKKVQVAGTGRQITATAADHLFVGLRFGEDVMATAHVQGGVPTDVSFNLRVFGDEGVLNLSSTGHLQRGILRLSGGRGLEPVVPLTVIDVAGPLFGDGPHANVARLYQRLASAILHGATPELPDFQHALKLHRLLEGLTQQA